MTLTRRTCLKAAAAAALMATFPLSSLAADVAGVKFDDTATVGGQSLKLNGAGVRTKVIFKVYALGLYLPEKKTTVADVLASQGARRTQIVFMRELTSEEFGQAFMNGLTSNTNEAERNKLLPQTKQFGELFASIPSVKKGDVLTVDWIPGTGTQCMLNGKKVGEVLPDLAFYNAILRIWLGDKPADSSLKAAMLGESK